MNIVLLSGGSGKRLWPLSNEVRSKQFLKVFKNEQGIYESMVQRVFHQIKSIDDDATIIIATSEIQVATIKSQLGEQVGISIEPCRRDTFPAIALATAYLHDVQKKNENEAVVVCPVDPYVEKDYFAMLKNLNQQAEKGEANLVLMGIEPTYPSEKYGYIIPKDQNYLSMVETFKEKPDTKTAEKYIKQGALWNGGVFAYKLKYVLDIAKEIWGNCSYEFLLSNYEKLDQISFDYAVVEKELNIQVMRFSGKWKDLGTWNTLTEAMSEKSLGKVTIDDSSINTHVLNELSIPIIALGVKNIVIAASPDGVLVADKNSSDKLKKYVQGIQLRPMYEECGWGTYKVLDYVTHPNGNNSITKYLIIKAGKYISYQEHKRRSEVWTFTEGMGTLVIDGQSRTVFAGDYVYIRPGMKHAIKATTELHIIEVQIGAELTEEDIIRYEWNEL